MGADGDRTVATSRHPSLKAKARRRPRRGASAPRSSTCRHRIHANPEPAFEEVQAATWIAEVLAPSRIRGRAPGRQPGDRGPRAGCAAWRAGEPGRDRPAHRDPRRVRRAARPRPRLRPQPDRRLRASARRIALAAIATGTARRDRLPRHAGRGASARASSVMIDDGLFEGSTPRCCSTPRPDQVELRLLLASMTSRSRSPACQAHAADRSVGRPERARRDDPAVQLDRRSGASSSGPTRASTGSSLDGGTAANIIPDRTIGRFMIRSRAGARLRARCGAIRASSVEAAALATGTTGTAECLRRLARRRSATTSTLAAVRRQHGRHGIADEPAEPELPRQLRHGQRQPGHADDPPESRDLRRRAVATPSSSARRPRPSGPTR